MAESKGFRGLIVILVGCLALSSCSPDSAEVRLTITYPTDDNNALRTFISSHGATSIRFWYTYDGLATTGSTGANVVQPATAIPDKVSTGQNTSANDWSTSKGPGTAYTSGDTIVLTNLPLGETGTIFAVEILQTLSADNKIHPVAFILFNGGPQALTEDKISSLSGALIPGRTCGSIDKASMTKNQFKGVTLTESLFTANCD